MNYSSPKRLSFFVSVILVGSFSLILFIASYISFADFGYIYVGSLIFLFVISFFVYRYALEKFIYERIKLLYKAIYVLKTPKMDEEPFFSKKNQIEDVNEKIMLWAESKKEEIEQLKKSDFFRTEYIGNVSHELKTPIFNIQGYILTLLDGGLEDPTINREYLLRAERSINRMISIVEDLELITNLESESMSLTYTHFDIVQLVKEVMEALEIKAVKKNASIYFSKSYQTSISVYADRERIRQVLINLVENSIKYGIEDGKTKISFFDMDEYYLIELADNGIGIDQIHLPRIFERFYRVDKSRSREQGGSGLGLSIVKHIIEAHNQTINVRSGISKGTTFGFTLAKERH